MDAKGKHHFPHQTEYTQSNFSLQGVICPRLKSNHEIVPTEKMYKQLFFWWQYMSLTDAPLVITPLVRENDLPCLTIVSNCYSISSTHWGIIISTATTYHYINKNLTGLR